MIKRHRHCIAGRLSRPRIDAFIRRICKVRDRFRHAPEHQNSPDTSGEEHGEPGQIGIVRPAVIRAQSYIAVAAAGQAQQKDQKGTHREDIEPSQVTSYPACELSKTTCNSFVKGDGKGYEKSCYSSRSKKDSRYGLQS